MYISLLMGYDDSRSLNFLYIQRRIFSCEWPIIIVDSSDRRNTLVKSISFLRSNSIAGQARVRRVEIMQAGIFEKDIVEIGIIQVG